MPKRGDTYSFRLGEERVNKQGIPMKIIAYRRDKDIDVLFLDGHGEIVRTEYKLFKTGATKSYKSIIGMRLMGHRKDVAGTIIDTIGHDKIVVQYDTGEICTIGRQHACPAHSLPSPYKRYNLSQFTEIPVWKGHYLDKEGNLYNSHGRMMKQKTSRGYKVVGTSIDGKRAWYSIHRLMALTFLPRVEGKDQVNHKDGNKANNRLENLEWASGSDNCLHRCRVLNKVRGENHGRAILTEDMVREIVRMRNNGYTYKEIAEHFNIYESRISSVMKGDAWTHVTGFPLRRDLCNKTA